MTGLVIWTTVVLEELCLSVSESHLFSPMTEDCLPRRGEKIQHEFPMLKYDIMILNIIRNRKAIIWTAVPSKESQINVSFNVLSQNDKCELQYSHKSPTAILSCIAKEASHVIFVLDPS